MSASHSDSSSSSSSGSSTSSTTCDPKVLLDEILHSYAHEYKTNPDLLRNAIPPSEVWSIFLDYPAKDGWLNYSGKYLRALLQTFHLVMTTSLDPTQEDFSVRLVNFLENVHSWSTRKALDLKPGFRTENTLYPVSFSNSLTLEGFMEHLEEVREAKRILISHQHCLLSSKINFSSEILGYYPSHWDYLEKVYIDMEDINRIGELFLMTLPSDGKYKVSDRYHLYLYRMDENKYVYYFNEEGEETEHGMDKVKLLNQFAFTATKSDLKKCEDEKLKEQVLRITSRRWHTRFKSRLDDELCDPFTTYQCLTLSKCERKPESIAQKTKEDILDLAKKFQIEVQLAAASKDKLEVLTSIARFIVKCHRYHPFRDGNGRAIVILLLQFLLKENGFPFTMITPELAGGYSAREWRDHIMEGMKRTLTLAREKYFYPGTHAKSLTEEILGVSTTTSKQKDNLSLYTHIEITTRLLKQLQTLILENKEDTPSNKFMKAIILTIEKQIYQGELPEELLKIAQQVLTAMIAIIKSSDKDEERLKTLEQFFQDKLKKPTVEESKESKELKAFFDKPTKVETTSEFSAVVIEFLTSLYNQAKILPVTPKLGA